MHPGKAHCFSELLATRSDFCLQTALLRASADHAARCFVCAASVSAPEQQGLRPVAHKLVTRVDDAATARMRMRTLHSGAPRPRQESVRLLVVQRLGVARLCHTETAR